MEQENRTAVKHCNGCANRCPVDSMQCARGLKLMGLDEQIKKQTAGIGAGQRNDASLSRLLRACSNKLFISGREEAFFDILAEDEKKQLAGYLERLSGQ